MADFNTSKIDGNTVAALEWNQFADTDNIIITSGQTPSSSDLNQLGIAAARYSSGGRFYIDSGATNSYILSPVSPFKSPIDSVNGYFNGMIINFRTNNPNSGASTVNVNSAGVKSLLKENGDPLTTGDIAAGSDVSYRYNGTSFLRIQGNATLLSRGQSYLSSPIILSNNSINPNTQIDFAAGNFIFTNGTNSGAITAITKTLQSSGAWAAGTNQNGLDTGVRANLTWYHSYVIQNNTSGVFDILFSTSATSPTVPSGWTNVYKIKNGQIYTDASSNIRLFIKTPNGFTKYLGTNSGYGNDYNVGSPAVQSNTLVSITVPNQPNILAVIKATAETGTTSSDIMTASFDGSVVSTMNTTNPSDVDFFAVGDASRYQYKEKLCLTNTAQIRFSIASANVGVRVLTFQTTGYFDLNL